MPPDRPVPPDLTCYLCLVSVAVTQKLEILVIPGIILFLIKEVHARRLTSRTILFTK